MAEHAEGRSVAAWTTVAILLVASFLICLAVVLVSRTMAAVGVALILVGLLAGKLLAMSGFGQPKREPSSNTAIR